MFDSMQQYIAVLAWRKGNGDLVPSLRSIWIQDTTTESTLSTAG